VSNVVRKYLCKETLVQSDLAVHFELRLANRKGWQRKIDKGETDLKGPFNIDGSISNVMGSLGFAPD
jgi:hypothetical protein